MRDFSTFKKRLLNNSEFKAAYDALEREFSIAETVIQKRLEKGLSQTDLAKKVGTQQSAISRLESGTYNPSMEFLEKIAKALGFRLQISFL